jgi:dCMP deaminase
MNWDCYFISEAYLSAAKSKDRSTQVGAVIVGTDREIRSKGYNGPPRGFNDDAEDIHTRPLKYALFCHAEENCVAASARVGVSTKGCTMYTTFHPCTRCARLIVQSGITEVVLHREFPGSTQTSWDEDREIASRIFNECGVTVRWWSGIPLIREVRCNGIIHRFG